ncbi:hypothetical protein SAMN05216604_13424 [Pseudomonas agarici]|nr:hypothetical protein SAMN05216604_13424 [Pseudomonas agarici]
MRWLNLHFSQFWAYRRIALTQDNRGIKVVLQARGVKVG